MSIETIRLDETVAESETITMDQPLDTTAAVIDEHIEAKVDGEGRIAGDTSSGDVIDHDDSESEGDEPSKVSKLSTKQKIIIGGASTLLLCVIGTVGVAVMLPQDNPMLGVWRTVSYEAKNVAKDLFSPKQEEMFRADVTNPLSQGVQVTQNKSADSQKVTVNAEHKPLPVNANNSDNKTIGLDDAQLIKTVNELDSDIKNSVASSLSEVAVSGTSDKREQLSIVLDGVNNERVALGKPRLTESQVIGTILYSSQKLGVTPTEAKAVIAETVAINNAKHLADVDVKAKSPKNDIEKAELIVSRINESAPEISDKSLINAARDVAQNHNVSSPLVNQIANGFIAEEKVISAAKPSDDIAAEDMLYTVTESAVMANSIEQTIAASPESKKQEVTNAVVNQTKLSDGKTPITRSLAQQQQTLKKSAKALNSSNEAIAIVNAKITAKHKARLDGKNVQGQEFAAEVAGAEVKAEQLQLNTYEAALYVADKANSSIAIDSVAVNRNMNPIAKEIAIAHHEARQNVNAEIKQAGAMGNGKKALADIAKVVSNAADHAKTSNDEKKFYVEQAVAIESKALGVSSDIQKVELARALAEIDAKSAGLSDLAVVAVGTGVASLAESQDQTLTAQEMNANAIQQAVSVVKAAGLNKGAEAEIAKSVQAYMEKTTLIPQSKPAGNDLESVVEIASSKATKEKLSPIERDAFIAKAKTEFKAAKAGLNPNQTKVAIARAQARARAESMGFSESRVIDIEMRAGNEAIEKLQLTEQEIQIISHAVVKMETNGAVKPIVTESQTKGTPVNVEVQDYSSELNSLRAENKEWMEQQNRLEIRVANLADKLTQTMDAVNKAVESNASLARTIVQLQAAVNSNAVELQNQREASQAEIDRRNSNSGWISSRVCEMEAAAGSFTNPTVCKAEYAKYRGQQPIQQRVAAPTQVQSHSLPINNLNDVPQAQYPGVPATAYTNEFQTGADRVYAQIPDSIVSNDQSAQYVVHDACSASNQNYSYLILGENSAVITNRAGASQRVVKGSYVPDLGAVVMFQAKVEPRFISFDNGVVCKQEFTGS